MHIYNIEIESHTQDFFFTNTLICFSLTCLIIKLKHKLEFGLFAK